MPRGQGVRRWLRRTAPEPAAPTGPPEAPPREPMVGRPAPTVPGAATIGNDGLVLFLTSSCLACRDIWGALSDGAAGSLSGDPAVTVVTPDPSLEDRHQVEALTPQGVPVVMSTPAWLSYGVRGSPWVVLVAGGVVVAEAGASGWADVVRLTSAIG